MRMHLGALSLTVFAVATFALAGCLPPPPQQPGPRYHGGPPPAPEGQPYDQNQPPPAPDGDRTPPPPPEGYNDQNPPPDRVRAVAPTAHRHHGQPSLAITLSTSTTSPGSEVSLYVNPARQPLIVYFNGRILPKKTDPSGTVLTVTIPADARSGSFEVEWSGQRFQSPYLTVQ
jgi:hypothetical protein